MIMKPQNYFSTISAPITYVATLNTCRASNCCSQSYFSITLYSLKMLSTSYILNLLFKSIYEKKKPIARLGYPCNQSTMQMLFIESNVLIRKLRTGGFFAHLFECGFDLFGVGIPRVPSRVGCSRSCSHPEAEALGKGGGVGAFSPSPCKRERF